MIKKKSEFIKIVYAFIYIFIVLSISFFLVWLLYKSFIWLLYKCKELIIIAIIVLLISFFYYFFKNLSKIKNVIKRHKIVVSFLCLFIVVFVLFLFYSGFYNKSTIINYIRVSSIAMLVYLLTLNFLMFLIREVFIKGFESIPKFRIDEFNMVFFSYSLLILYLVAILLWQIFKNFLKSPSETLETNLTIYMFSVTLTIWPWFFNCCFWKCKSGILYKKISPKFWTKLIKAILVAIIAFVLVQTNISENIRSFPYPKNVNLLYSNRFARELLYVIAYVLSGTATLYYPMIDMYEYTRNELDKD